MIRKIHVTIIGTFLTWILCICIGRLLVSHDLGGANLVKTLDPWYASSLLKTTISSKMQSQTVESDDLLRLSQKEPLEKLSYKANIQRALTANDQTALVNTANYMLKLKPRDRTARLIILNNNLLTGNNEAALSSLSELIALNKNKLGPYGNILLDMGKNPASRESLIGDITQNQPIWGSKLALEMVKTYDDLAPFKNIFKIYPETQTAYLTALAKRNNLGTAYAHFLDFLPDDVKAKSTTPFDAKFENISAPKPFNWKINKSLASYERPRNLYVRYFGKSDSYIAEQIMAMPKGTYNFSTQMKGNLYSGAGHFAWTLTCVGTKSELMTLDIKELAPTEQSYETGFSIPQSCPFQKLNLTGIPGSFSRLIRAEISDVNIVKKSF